MHTITIDDKEETRIVNMQTERLVSAKYNIMPASNTSDVNNVPCTEQKILPN